MILPNNGVLFTLVEMCCTVCALFTPRVPWSLGLMWPCLPQGAGEGGPPGELSCAAGLWESASFSFSLSDHEAF